MVRLAAIWLQKVYWLSVFSMCQHSYIPFILFSTVMRQTFIVGCMFVSTSVLGPIMYNLWIFNGSANANFYFAVTLAFNTAQVSTLKVSQSYIKQSMMIWWNADPRSWKCIDLSCKSGSKNNYWIIHLKQIWFTKSEKNIFRMNMQINRYVGKHGKASCGNLDVTPTVYCSNGLLPSTASKAKDAPNII